MDRLADITTFVKVVERGGFSAAARDLGMAPSMATAHVQSLEQRLGARLLNRSTRKVSLTEVGAAYYDRCLKVLDSLEDADRTVEALQSTPRGTLKLNTSVIIPAVIAPVIAEFTSLYPEVSVNLTMSGRMVDLVEDGFDLAIRNAPIPDSRLMVRRLAGYRFVICGSPRYFEARPRPERPADLALHNCLIYSDADRTDQWPFSGRDGGEVRLTGNFRSNSVNALLHAAENGQGLIVAPRFVVEEHLRTGRFLPVLGEYLETEYAINAIYPHRVFLSSKVSTFIDMLIKHFRASPSFRQNDVAARARPMPPFRPATPAPRAAE